MTEQVQHAITLQFQPVGAGITERRERVEAPFIFRPETSSAAAP
jgi:hypothetical protein